VRWNIDKALYVMHLCRLICRAASVHADGTKLKGRLASSGTISAIERIVRSEPRHSASVDEWDSSVWLLNTPGGIVDLRTGARGPHDRERRMTKVTTAKRACKRKARGSESLQTGDQDAFACANFCACKLNKGGYPLFQRLCAAKAVHQMNIKPSG
jgi:hypothetical protein